MKDLIDTTEMYLRTVFELQEEGIPPLRARIAERLEQSGPTVSQTVARMERDGLLNVGEDRQIRLTPTGQGMAAQVMRKHRLAECLLVEILDVPWDQVHTEACRWEHVISDTIEEHLDRVLGHPEVSPFGNRIPGQATRSHEAAERPELPSGAMTLLDAAGPEPKPVRVLRIDEAGQTDAPTLVAFRRAGLLPGSMVDCRRQDGYIQVGRAGESTDVSPDLAAHILVVPMESLDGANPDAD